MSPKLQQVIEMAEELTSSEQEELIKAVFQFLRQNHSEETSTVNFWQPLTLEEIIQLQAKPVIRDFSDLQADFWPDEESVDEFLEYLAQERIEIKPPASESKGLRPFGLCAGEFTVPDNFDDPLQIVPDDS